MVIAMALLAHYFGTRGIFHGMASDDGMVAFLYLPGLLFHHTFDLAPVAEPVVLNAFRREVTGHISNRNPIGPPILWAPFFALTWAIKGAAASLSVLLGAQTPRGLSLWLRQNSLQHHGVVAEVSEEVTHLHTRVNDLWIFGLPPGSELNELDFELLRKWWR